MDQNGCVCDSFFCLSECFLHSAIHFHSVPGRRSMLRGCRSVERLRIVHHSQKHLTCCVVVACLPQLLSFQDVCSPSASILCPRFSTKRCMNVHIYFLRWNPWFCNHLNTVWRFLRWSASSVPISKSSPRYHITWGIPCKTMSISCWKIAGAENCLLTCRFPSISMVVHSCAFLVLIKLRCKWRTVTQKH